MLVLGSAGEPVMTLVDGGEVHEVVGCGLGDGSVVLRVALGYGAETLEVRRVVQHMAVPDFHDNVLGGVLLLGLLGEHEACGEQQDRR